MNLRYQLEKSGSLNNLQEIRLKVNKPVILIFSDKEIVLTVRTSAEDIRATINKISKYSIFAFEEDVKQGFITIQGGHRVGITGEWIFENGQVKYLKNISSLNIRICKEVMGFGRKFINYIYKGGEILNTLIISPPKCGKTTLLRDLSKIISNGDSPLNRGFKVSVIDERSEIAASFRGIPQLDVGIRTDVYDNCLKSKGIILAIRSMAPEVIICDEIGTREDFESVLIAYNSGVSIISTIHGSSEEDFYNKLRMSNLNTSMEKIFKCILILSNKNGIGTLERVKIV
ncbi:MULTISPECIES: stage III sporulation protein AA [unclassified Candidatus Neoarthromitus]|uniref:stage III sporulation protein AA n=1 Tax=unclassified Candidatus Neoarthromitus TaxID=2638829 RepID=UPI001FA802CF|nr:MULTISPECIES: stage III sporulation protein AA [unclassified Candidatus Arthromitus]